MTASRNSASPATPRALTAASSAAPSSEDQSSSSARQPWLVAKSTTLRPTAAAPAAITNA